MHDCAFGHGIKDSTRSTSNRKHFLIAFSDDRTTNNPPFIVMDLQPSSFDRARIRTYSNHLTPLDSEDSEARRASLLITSSAARKYPHRRTAQPGHQPPKPVGLHFLFTRAQLESTTAPNTPRSNHEAQRASILVHPSAARVSPSTKIQIFITLQLIYANTFFHFHNPVALHNRVSCAKHQPAYKRNPYTQQYRCNGRFLRVRRLD